MTVETVKTITSNMQYKSFTPPINDFQLGREAMRKGLLPQPEWSERMLAGWNFQGEVYYGQAMTEGV